MLSYGPTDHGQGSCSKFWNRAWPHLNAEATSALRCSLQRYANELGSEYEYFRDIRAVDGNGESLELAESLIAKKSTKLDEQVGTSQS
jgi:hypothetical protein